MQWNERSVNSRRGRLVLLWFAAHILFVGLAMAVEALAWFVAVVWIVMTAFVFAQLFRICCPRCGHRIVQRPGIWAPWMAPRCANCSLYMEEHWPG